MPSQKAGKLRLPFSRPPGKYEYLLQQGLRPLHMVYVYMAHYLHGSNYQVLTRTDMVVFLVQVVIATQN